MSVEHNTLTGSDLHGNKQDEANNWTAAQTTTVSDSAGPEAHAFNPNTDPYTVIQVFEHDSSVVPEVGATGGWPSAILFRRINNSGVLVDAALWVLHWQNMFYGGDNEVILYNRIDNAWYEVLRLTQDGLVSAPVAFTPGGGYGSQFRANYLNLYGNGQLESPASSGHWRLLNAVSGVGIPLNIGAPQSAPDDTTLAKGSVECWLDESGNKLMFRAKYANGTTLKSGSVNLT